jgi:predicted aspartyl protease/tetratricopeptide (TPR) repeat protein
MIARAFAFALTVSALAAGPALAADPPKCTLGKVVELPVTMTPGLKPLVPAKINGQDVMMMVDSGAFYSFVTEAAAQRLGLHLSMAPLNLRISGTTGEIRYSVGHADKFELDRIPLGRADFVVGGVAFDPEASGILGDNILNALDVEYDFAHGVMRLFKPMNCHNETPTYWAQGMSVGEVQLRSPEPLDPQPHGEGKINGQTIRITFDTGASLSGLKLSTARRLGFDPASQAAKNGGLSIGGNGRGRDAWIAPFDSLDIGGEQIRNIELRVADVELGRSDMLLGADFFLSHRVYVSRAQHKLYFTYNGGPVFKLDRPTPAGAQQAANAQAATAPVPGATTDEPTDAAGYVRRADAEIARRNFPAALADLTKAIGLAPDNAGYLFQRANVHLSAREPVLAMADLDAALKITPDDPKIRLLRGELYLVSHDQARAEADFEAAQKAAPAGSRIPLEVAVAYERQAQFAKAIALYDKWIADHPRDEAMGQILQSRCWARTLSGKDLDAALTDCEQALRKGPRIAAMFNAKGLTELRLGRYDAAIEDYNKAIEMQPKMPWALLGRGYAKHAKGQKAEGDADVAAAKALAPNLAKAADGFGIKDAAAGA